MEVILGLFECVGKNSLLQTAKSQITLTSAGVLIHSLVGNVFEAAENKDTVVPKITLVHK